MGVAYFYHLTRRPLEDTLSMLLGKALQAGWHVAVRGRDHARLAWLDERLWLGGEDGFLPHGLAGGDHDADQPVLLTTGAAGNGASCVMSVDGADVTAAELATLERVCVLLMAMTQRRCRWRAVSGNRSRKRCICAILVRGKWQMGDEGADVTQGEGA